MPVFTTNVKTRFSQLKVFRKNKKQSKDDEDTFEI